MARSIGQDVHRDFCELAVADGGRARSAGRVATRPEDLELFAESLTVDDRVVLEATGNALAIARIIEPHFAEVVLAHAQQVRAISHARVKTDKIDALMLADLLAADLIPRVWVGDERTRTLRRLVSRRRGLVKRRTQVKNEISAVLQRNLKGRPPASDLFGRKGRTWLAAQELPADERLTVDAGRAPVTWSATSACTPGCASQAADRLTTDGSPSRARRRPVTCSSRRPGWRPPLPGEERHGGGHVDAGDGQAASARDLADGLRRFQAW